MKKNLDPKTKTVELIVSFRVEVPMDFHSGKALLQLSGNKADLEITDFNYTCEANNWATISIREI